MAAPTVPKSKAKANLNSIVSKEQSKKPTQKHVLCPEIISWPRPSKPVEESILSKLCQILKDAPNIFHCKKKIEDDKDKAEKERIRSQLQIGTSSVLRALERNDLQCVLVSGKATPAITVDHVISLSKDRGCPLLCLDGLSAALALALESKCLPLSIGFRKLQDGQQSDFSEVIALVKDHTHWSAGSGGSDSSSLQNLSSQQTPSQKDQPSLSSKYWGKQRAVRINTSDKKDVLAEIKRVFSSSVNESPVPDKGSKQKKKKRKGKRNVKEPFEKDLHSQFEAGKRTVVGAVERGRVELVLISHEVEEVVNSSPLFQEKIKFPPVIVLPGLTSTLRDLTSGACGFSFMAIKKLKLLPSDSKQDFKQVIEMCYKSLKTAVKQGVGAENKDLLATNCMNSEQESSNGATNTDKERRENQIETREEEEDDDEEEEEEEDYSYLYTLKEDSKDLAELRAELKCDVERMKKDTSFSVDFISLSSSTTEDNKKSSKSRSKQQNKIASVKQPNTITPKNARISKTESSEEISPSSQTLKSQESSDYLSLKSAENSTLGGHLSQSQPEVPVRTDEKQPETSMDFISFSSSQEQPTAQTKQAEDDKDQKSASTICVSGAGDLSKNDHRGNSAGSSNSNETSEQSNLSLFQPAESSLFLLDRKGDAASKTSKTSRVSGALALNSGEKIESGKQEEILVVGDLKPSKGKEGLDILSIDVAARSKNKTKALKRKLGQEEGFISFKYTEANINTMVANPEKKRKKKKKK
ncbi:ribonuclease P protein subunit p38 [Elysia marginata]|uniref:Ribonuclease P protein subunit p38 n=1 Tax=Elysia marginata TaxID=1093978 RepID=A0AAV4J7I7_9GAST|nr:ribonuclease P protein subunit p38 [Elysia marginata]